MNIDDLHPLALAVLDPAIAEAEQQRGPWTAYLDGDEVHVLSDGTIIAEIDGWISDDEVEMSIATHIASMHNVGLAALTALREALVWIHQCWELSVEQGFKGEWGASVLERKYIEFCRTLATADTDAARKLKEALDDPTG